MKLQDWIDLGTKYDFGELLASISQVQDTDIATLRRCLSQDVPTWFENTVGLASLPFPPELVGGISNTDVEVLQRAFALGPGSRCAMWSVVYFDINLEFFHSGQTARAGEIAAETRSVAEEYGVSAALLLLAPAQAFLAEQKKKEVIPKRADQKARTKEARKQAVQYYQAIDLLLTAAEGADQPAETEALWIRTMAGSWITNHKLEETLAELKGYLENKEKFLAQLERQRHHGMPHTRGGLTDDTVCAYGCIREIIAEKGSYWAPGDASRLLMKWGLDVKADTIRKRRSR